MIGNNEYAASVTRGGEDSVPCRASVWLACQMVVPWIEVGYTKDIAQRNFE
jgi:hypothetical protein